ncbi:MAG: GNAT family N-acetyltransferase [Pseudomonadota bacterium]
MIDITDMTQRTGARRDIAGRQDGRGPARTPGYLASGAPQLRDVPPRRDHMVPLAEIAFEPWQRLADAAIEPNGYYLPDWEAAVNAFARGRGGAFALTAWGGANEATGAARLIGLLPVVSAWRAYKIPLPALVSADPYGALGTPLLDRTAAEDAARRLMRQARDAGQHALILREVPLEGPALAAFTRVLASDGLHLRVLQAWRRAALDATGDAEARLGEGLSHKKLKNLRRLRHRLGEHGEVTFKVASRPDEIGPALDAFLALEARGWKAQRGTALAQHDGDVRFMRSATAALAARGACEIVTLTAGDTPVAAGVVLRHQGRAFWFKIGIDERFAKISPGVQLALDLTRHLCADDVIADADSTAVPDHPMIDPIWSARLAVGDVLIPLKRNDPMPAVIHGALRLREAARTPARRLVHTLRAIKERQQ